MSVLKWGLIMIGISVASGVAGYLTVSSLLNPPVKITEELPVVSTEARLPCKSCVYISKGEGTSFKTNPILNVDVYKNGNLLETYNTLSGRWSTQALDRNIAGNGSPSPNGTYTLMEETTGYHAETGGVFLPYEANFSTERSALGFHWDPSWGLDNGEDGTVGCHAFKSLEDYKSFVETITSNNIKTLIINYE